MDITHLRKQILKEAAYNFSLHLNNGGVAFFGRRNAPTPGMLVKPNDTTSLMNAESMTIIQVNVAAGNRLWKQWYINHTGDEYTLEGRFISIWRHLGTENSFKNIQNLGESPEVFKISIVEGREKIFKVMTTDLRMPLPVYEKYFGEIPDLGEDHFIKFNGARVFIPDNMRAATRKRMLSILEELFQILKSFGFGFLFHGDIRFIKLDGNTAGLYMVKHKTMSIQPFVKKNSGVIYTLLHEFTHKYWYEYMDEKARLKVKQKYNELRKNGVGHIEDSGDFDAAKANVVDSIKVGTPVEYVGRKQVFKRIKYFTIGSIAGNGDWSAYATMDPDKQPRVSGGPAVFLNKKWKILDTSVNIVQWESKDKYEDDQDQWFPTKYSMTNAEEWWAELMSFYFSEKLTGDPFDFINEVLEV